MHLLKARSDPKGYEIEATDLPKEARAAYRAKQSALVDLGVAGVALMCVATHAANIEGNLADEGLELLLEMLNDGNQVVQASCDIVFCCEKMFNESIEFLLVH